MNGLLQTIEGWFNSPRAHLIGTVAFGVAAQVWPQYALVLNGVAGALGYGGVVAGAAAPAAPKA